MYNISLLFVNYTLFNLRNFITIYYFMSKNYYTSKQKKYKKNNSYTLVIFHDFIL